MKKLALIISILMVFSMVACDNNNDVNDNAGNVEDLNDNVNNPNDQNNGVVENGDNTGILGGDEDTETLTGSAQGYGGEVTVTVMVNGDDIVSVEAKGEKETQGVGSNAIEQLPDKIVEADSTDVEVVSGATVTSNAIKQAVDKALEGRK